MTIDPDEIRRIADEALLGLRPRCECQHDAIGPIDLRLMAWRCPTCGRVKLTLLEAHTLGMKPLPWTRL